MKNKEKIFNIDYALAQGLYWAVFCVTSSFAAVFLQHRGYTNAQLGTILSSGSVVCLFLSPALANLIDHSKKFTAARALVGLLAFQFAVMLAIRFLSGRSWLLSVCYSSFLACMICTNPMNTQLSIAVEELGVHINYGAARGIGSLTYAISAVFFGAAIEHFSPELLPALTLIMIILQCVVLYAIHRRMKLLPAPAAKNQSSHETSSMLGFIKKYKRYCFFLIGVALMYFTHTLFNNFFINIVRNLGGNAEQMGRISGLMAFLELPAMFLLDRICRKVHISTVMSIALVFFLLKFVLMTMAASLPFLYASQVLQGLGFAVVVPGLVRYAAVLIPAEDSAKAQALSYNSTTLGNVFSGFLGGRMFDMWDVKTALIVSCIIAAVGLVVCELSLERKKN